MQKVFVTDSSGKRHAVWIDVATGACEWARGKTSQLVLDISSYSYTHGGALYQAACERWIDMVVENS